MVDYDENGYAAELKEKPVCRFCLTQDDTLTNIYSTKSNANSQASLSMQIMACVSIEVFADDEMPNTICHPCRALMDYCYRFKQMCKKADTLLKQYPLTGVWPDRLDHPKFPIKLHQNNKSSESREPLTAQSLKRKLPQTITISTPSKRLMTTSSSQIENEIPIEDMVVEYADEQIIEEILPTPKILNIKPAPIKILNKQASTIKSIEPVLRTSVVKTSEDGKIEVVSEIMESDDPELDPIKNAAPVETNVFPCNYCERSFPLRQLLDIHIANHVRDRKFQCMVCNKGFFSKYDLGKHELIHTGEKPFKCVVCGKAFSRSTLLRRHEKVHSDQPKFLCAYCERPFLSKEEWEKHTQNHQKKRPFTCDVCNKSFAFKQGLERHEIVHSTDQPFKCEHCDQGFSTQGKLARHLTAHAGDRPYPCRICDKSYLLSHHLTRHMRSHKENNQIIHKCSECYLSFAKRDELVTHSTVHATENLVCPLCKTTFDDVDDVSEHIKQHTEGEQFACEFCDLIFLTETQLHEHSDTQHLEEIELYEMSNTNDESFDDSTEYVKPDTDEIIEYTEQVEIITPNEILEHVDSPVPKTKTVNRSYGKSNAKQIKQEIVKTTPTIKSSKSTGSDENSMKILVKTSNNLSPNTRASTINAKNANKSGIVISGEKTPDKTISTRSSKTSPITGKLTSIEKSSTTPATTTVVKKLSSQTSLTKFLTIKPSKSNEQNEPNTPTTLKKLIPLPTVKTEQGKTTGSPPKLANKLVKVKQIRMTKQQIEALTKEGKIEMRGGQMIFKKETTSPKKK
ncbi:zinc finger protein 629-like [Contarinia nasturtii]|uniref:zinc finger protein 629-like n=1 Tax=Contarinia nasturtii TaxID=265458 RepID=UPI0012D3FB42|nr:zinc finger protein 629-like [Contarinia nasturtii]